MIWHLITVFALLSGLPDAEPARVQNIEFFGTAGIDVARVRSALPIHSGDEVTEDQSVEIRSSISRAVQEALGHKPTDQAIMCCNAPGEVTIYVGLGGRNSVVVPFLPQPRGSACLPDIALHLYDDAIAAFGRAVERGQAEEDDSRGYSLSTDAATRAKQLAMREYAIANERTIKRALRGCGDPQHRLTAAALLGYARKSSSQIKSLVRASRDSDQGVRNNAVRAVWVLASSDPTIADQISAGHFVTMLNSKTWTDRNKAGMLLVTLTSSRNRRLLQRIRSEAMQSLIEMARWEDADHSYAYRILLGRIAGLREEQIQQLIGSGKVDEIIAAAAADRRLGH